MDETLFSLKSKQNLKLSLIQSNSLASIRLQSLVDQCKAIIDKNNKLRDQLNNLYNKQQMLSNANIKYEQNQRKTYDDLSEMKAIENHKIFEECTDKIRTLRDGIKECKENMNIKCNKSEKELKCLKKNAEHIESRFAEEENEYQVLLMKKMNAKKSLLAQQKLMMNNAKLIREEINK